MLDLLERHSEAFLYDPTTPMRKESPGPRAVRLVHRQTGVGNAVIEHRVEIRHLSGELIADFPARWTSRWLADRSYAYVPGTNGLWSRT